MTPKEKAKELIFNFSPLVTIWDCYHDEPRQEQLILQDAKKCAKIAVNEIIEAIDWHVNETPNQEFIFWDNVLNEIDKT
jgi:hypothetical protein